MKKSIRFSVICIFVLVCISSLLLSIGFTYMQEVVNAEKPEDKFYCKVLEGSEYEDNKINVVLNKEATFMFKEYTSKDFEEVDCIEVKNIFKNSEEIVKKQLVAEKDNNWKELMPYVENNMLIDIGTYRTALCLTLARHDKKHVIEAIEVLMKRKDVFSAEPNYIMGLSKTHSNANTLKEQWALENIDAESAWDRCVGSNTIIVGVLDTGIDGSNPELSSRIETSLCADFSSGVTVVTPTPVDMDGHGTHVAGIIGAIGLGSGISGVCWDIKIVSLRVFDNDGYTT